MPRANVVDLLLPSAVGCIVIAGLSATQWNNAWSRVKGMREVIASDEARISASVDKSDDEWLESVRTSLAREEESSTFWLWTLGGATLAAIGFVIGWMRAPEADEEVDELID